MKIRTDFVTNSSSSLFVLGYENKNEAITSINNALSYYPEALARVLCDVQNAIPLTTEQLNECLQDEAESYAYSKMCFGEGGWWSSSKPTFENLFKKRHPGLDYSSMREHPEWKAEKKRIMDEYLTDIKEKLKDKPYVIAIEYSDNDGYLDSELEHYVMPQLDDVIESFNHH